MISIRFKCLISLGTKLPLLRVKVDFLITVDLQLSRLSKTYSKVLKQVKSNFRQGSRVKEAQRKESLAKRGGSAKRERVSVKSGIFMEEL